MHTHQLGRAGGAATAEDFDVAVALRRVDPEARAIISGFPAGQRKVLAVRAR